MDEEDIDFFERIVKYIFGLSFLVVLIFSVVSPIKRIYDVWAEARKGEAELARADSNRKIKIKEAESYREAAKSLAEAEVIRAKGVAESNRIIGDSLKENESYLRYLWVQGLQTNQMQVVYIPTEAGLPILEANSAIRK